MELVVLPLGKIHTVPATKSKLIRLFCLDDFVYVACLPVSYCSSDEGLLMNHYKLLMLFNSKHIDMTLILPAHYCVLVNHAQSEYIALCHESIQYLESKSI